MIKKTIKNEMIRKVGSLLNKNFKNHPTPNEIEGEGSHLKMMRSLGASCVNYLLFGKCSVCIESCWQEIEWYSESYVEPKTKYNGFFGIDPHDEENIEGIASVIAEGLLDEGDISKFIEVARQIPAIMSEIFNKFETNNLLKS